MEEVYFKDTVEACKEAIAEIRSNHFRKQCKFFLKVLGNIYRGDIHLEEHEVYYGMGFADDGLRFWFVDEDIEFREVFTPDSIDDRVRVMLKGIMRDYSLNYDSDYDMEEFITTTIIRQESAIKFLDMFLVLIENYNK